MRCARHHRSRSLHGLQVLWIVALACDPAPRGGGGTTGQDCASGFIDDGGRCVPAACGTGTWGDLPVDEATVYVDAAVAEGGDGSSDAPLTSIQSALDLAGSHGGGPVVVAAGSYPEVLTLGTQHADVQLAGRCRELVIVDATAGDESTAGITVNTGHSEVRVSGLTVQGSPYLGVLVPSGTLRLADARVEESAWFGLAAYSGNPMAPAVLDVERSDVVAATGLGILVQDDGTEVRLLDVTVRDTRPDSAGDGGYGVLVKAGGLLEAESCSLWDNAECGLGASGEGSRVALWDSAVGDTRGGADGRSGYGISVEGAATLTAEGCVLAGNASVGIRAMGAGTVVALAGSTVRGTTASPSGDQGHGVQINDGAVLELCDCELVGNRGTGILAFDEGTAVAISNTVVRDTLPSEGDFLGFGIDVYGGASLWADGCVIRGNTALGVAVFDAGTEVTLLRTVVEDTRPIAGVESGFGVQVTQGASLVAEDCGIIGNTSVGLQLGHPGTEVQLRGSTIRDTSPDAVGLGGYGISAQAGASLMVEDCLLASNHGAGLVAYEPGTLAVVSDSTVADTIAAWGAEGMVAIGVGAQLGATVVGHGLEARGNEGPGVRAVSAGSRLVCTGCSLVDNQFAGAVTNHGGALELTACTIRGTLEGANLGGGVGVYAAEQQARGLTAPSLLLADSVVSDNLVGAVWLAGGGSYRISGSTLSGSAGVAHGGTTRCGDGVFGSGLVAWDGGEGLLLEDNLISGNHGAGLFLDDASAWLAGNSWSGNDPDLLVQGGACLEPLDAYTEAPVQDVCPQWDRPTCELEFGLSLETAGIDPGRPPVPLLPRAQDATAPRPTSARRASPPSPPPTHRR